MATLTEIAALTDNIILNTSKLILNADYLIEVDNLSLPMTVTLTKKKYDTINLLIYKLSQSESDLTLFNKVFNDLRQCVEVGLWNEQEFSLFLQEFFDMIYSN